ncbi:isoprenoid biosynthesis protein ElbB [Haematospirillum sp. H1815]|uniref:isoprenoid biosynthesis protein ElbB n=1 Tax=Haematospirillum sp. H1815 TaxID=2723108 RepID=UPI00143A2137|nr:isoprenoid biosynthesis protein ElbB [Haematospirillum sp. H1815]NKD76871.1 isoprenoid biosynthesis protein ElbB [Haematospirillum sp. H1815]
MSAPRVAVVLSGCGVRDGVGTHEPVLTLLTLVRHGAIPRCFAPDVKETEEERAVPVVGRSVQMESARIARGSVTSLSEFQAADYDAVMFPGVFGVVTDLPTFSTQGADIPVDPDVGRCIRDAHAAGLPIGALCMPPAVLSRILGQGVDLAVVESNAVEQRQEDTENPVKVDVIALDPGNRVVTTPDDMFEATVERVGNAVDNVVQALLKMVSPAHDKVEA